MSLLSRRGWVHAGLVLVWLAAALALETIPSTAGGVPTEADLIKALMGKGTRAMQPADLERETTEKALIDSLRKRGTRAFTVKERQKVAELVADKPQIDLEINFDFNSATITPEAVPLLVALGKALSDGKFTEASFLVAGHTDAKGSAVYN